MRTFSGLLQDASEAAPSRTDLRRKFLFVFTSCAYACVVPHPDVEGKSGTIFGASGEAARSPSFVHVHHEVHDR